MDSKKLIEQLNRYFEGETLPRGTALDAATALSTLQAENEKLRAEVESLKKGHCAGCSIPAVKAEQIRDLTDAPKLRAELGRMKRERDAAVKVVERVRSCKDCGHYTGEWTPPCKECQNSEEHHPYFKWRSQKED